MAFKITDSTKKFIRFNKQKVAYLANNLTDNLAEKNFSLDIITLEITLIIILLFTSSRVYISIIIIKKFTIPLVYTIKRALILPNFYYKNKWLTL